MKKLLCMILALLMVFTCMACAGGGGVSTTDPPDKTTSPATEQTSAPTTEATVPATQAATEATEATTPATTEAETQPQETAPKETVPKETDPKVTEPKETVPKETEPAETEPAETTPPETTPPATEGNAGNEGGNGYPNDPATCKHKGIKLVESQKATPEQDGYTLLRCSDCGYEIRTVHEYTPPEETEPKETNPPQFKPAADPAEVAAYLLQYINQFRAEQGSTQLTWLPGMSNVAKYRSQQLVTNFAHDGNDMREAAAYYKYGELIDMTAYGYDASDNYYRTNSQEAIGKGEGPTVRVMSAEELGRKMAEAYLNSAGHWQYLGSSEYSFVGVGVTYANGAWYDCVMVGRVNYG